jgi:PAS domain-containing protein
MKQDSEAQHSERERLQPKFDAQAASLGLELNAPNAYGRDIGVFVRFIAAVVDVGVPKSADEPGERDDAALSALIRAWEELDPDEIGKRWKDYATDPFIGIGRGVIAYMNDVGYRLWRYSEELRRELEEFPPYSPRQVDINEMRVRYVGRTTAVATYSVAEKYRNGRVRVTNAGVMALKIPDGSWKVAAETLPEKTPA